MKTPEQRVATLLVQYVAPILKKRGIKFEQLDERRMRVLGMAYALGAWDKNKVKSRIHELCDAVK